jgi:YD repeat-containing protein
MSKRRIDPVVLLILLIVPLAVAAALRFSRPAPPGAALLREPAPSQPVTHDLAASYEPLHKGHFDLGTGLYVREDDDFVLHATPSFVFRRTYRTQDRISREFGVGAMHNADWYLIGDTASFQWAALVLADGGRIEFSRVSTGTSYSDALFEHWGSPSMFYGSRLGWAGLGWLLRLHDGSLMKISACGPDGRSKCTLLDIRDSDGHRTSFQRDSASRLLKIDTGPQSIAFSYDDRGRVVEAHDSSGHRLRYTYDDAGRLARAAASDGPVRSYAYDNADRMTRVEEPGRIVENAYDAEGLCQRQVVRFTDASGKPSAREPYVYELSYRKDDGRISQTDLRQSSGQHRRIKFNPTGYMISDTYAPDTQAAVEVSYDRDASTNVVTAVTVTCPSGRWRVPRSMPVEPGREEEAVGELYERWCTPSPSNKPRGDTRIIP